MTLNEYITQEGVSMRDMASAVGVTYEAIRKYANGERLPKPDILRRIIKATGGAVQPNDFYAAFDGGDCDGAA